MKYLIPLMLIVLVAGCTTPSQTGINEGVTDTGNKVTGDVTVVIKDFAFAPNDITIPKGTTVIWTNEDTAPHTVFIESTSKGSPAINSGRSWSYTFTETGKFSYHCSFHSYMKATINVV